MYCVYIHYVYSVRCTVYTVFGVRCIHSSTNTSKIQTFIYWIYLITFMKIYTVWIVDMLVLFINFILSSIFVVRLLNGRLTEYQTMMIFGGKRAIIFVIWYMNMIFSSLLAISKRSRMCNSIFGKCNQLNKFLIKRNVSKILHSTKINV